MTTDHRMIDAIFDALADDVRRTLVAYLQSVSEASVEELVTVTDRQAGGLRDDARDVLSVRLHHVHLPKLADADLVEYDRTAGRVRYVGGSEIADLLAIVPPETVAE